MRRCSRNAILPVLGALSLMAVIPAAAKDAPVRSAWAAEPVKVDGLDLEWTAAELAVDKDTQAAYGFRNDGRNLYLVFIFNDPKSLSSIDATGMTVYSNAEGKKKKDNGIVFKARRVNAQELIAAWEKDGQVVTEERKREIAGRPFYVLYESEVIDKKRSEPGAGDPGAAPAEPPLFRNALKDKIAVYEFRIPLSRAGQPGGIGAAPGAAIKLGFEWGGMTEEMRKAMMARRAAAGSQAATMDTSMEGAIRGGDERADAGRDTSSPFMRGPKKHSFWIDLELAAPPGGF
ncbi:MAG: hypothetical protein JW742_02180 [Candidatus Aminicenantes bacterium]|nr:hypothetical protein [Candidatus Aminicenantes bacterium]